jgi:fused signal recognition particle receptor
MQLGLNIFRKKSTSTAEAGTEQSQKTWLQRLRQGLSKTRNKLSEQITTLFLGKKQIDAELLESLETLLISADFGVTTTERIINGLTQKMQRNQLSDSEALLVALRTQLSELLQPCQKVIDSTAHQPYVILMIGINGAGKTTTIGKLAHHFQKQGRSVMLAAGDTFRAAAVEQLAAWGERNNIEVISQATGADSASVIYDAVQAAKARQVDILLADTAGRLQNKNNLMDELKKIKRVITKADGTAPHEVMLVLDAGIGQNAISQVKEFHEAIGVTALAITKLDGSAKGGVIFSIAERFNIPITFIGVGEKIDDLHLFDSNEFVQALFDESL